MPELTLPTKTTRATIMVSEASARIFAPEYSADSDNWSINNMMQHERRLDSEVRSQRSENKSSQSSQMAWRAKANLRWPKFFQPARCASVLNSRKENARAA